MSESLIIEGKQYISARRAAEIAEYSKDYVGQLCRSGKLVCRMVGRFWYIDEKSLIKHKEESFKANQTSFGSNGFSPRNSNGENSSNSTVSSNGTISVDLLSGYSFVPALKQTLFVALVVAAVFVGGATVLSMSKPFLPQAIPQTASVYSAFNAVTGMLSSAFNEAYIDIAWIFSSRSNQSVAVNSADQDPNDSATLAHGGLVVVPQPESSSASSTAVTDAKLAQSITNTFSDNITIKPGPNGTTGVITPEFRTIKGHDFLYVLVPVKTSSSTQASDGTSTAAADQSSTK